MGGSLTFNVLWSLVQFERFIPRTRRLATRRLSHGSHSPRGALGSRRRGRRAHAQCGVELVGMYSFLGSGTLRGTAREHVLGTHENGSPTTATRDPRARSDGFPSE